MIQMPLELAQQGYETLDSILDWMEKSVEESDKSLSHEVISHLRGVVKASSVEEIEIIMAWMYVGVLADQLMDRIRAHEMAKNVVDALKINEAGPDMKGGA